jgi:hypothetical protein
LRGYWFGNREYLSFLGVFIKNLTATCFHGVNTVCRARL